MAGIFSNIRDFIDSFLPSATYSATYANPKKTPIQQFVQSAQAAAPQPTAQPVAPVQPGGFRYRMGASDYSDLTPQVQKALKGTPLEAYAQNFIQSGNAHKVDPRVLVTIANNESSLGRNYPTESYNPFGYNARSAGTIIGPDGKKYIDVKQGLMNAGFKSLPHAIDALTARFSDQPVNPTGPAYQAFRQDPSPENLQSAYNASDDEKAGYIKKTNDFINQQGFQ